MTDFLFDLPVDRIAKYPRSVRSHSRLMLVDPISDSVSEDRFDGLVKYLAPEDLLVFNNSKVIPARLLLRKQTGGKVEMFLERVLVDGTALVLLKSSKSIAVGSRLILSDEDEVTVLVEDRKEDFFVVRLFASVDWYALLQTHGRVPLPPYMRRDATDEDTERYQTVYAETPGSVAAPTAGLHFDQSLFAKIERAGICSAWLNLHVGYGTFAPLRSSDVDHLHQERFAVSQECCDAVARARSRGGRVIAVGTTTCRVLETLATKGDIQATQGETNLFIKPGFSFSCVDALITNFHLPGSSLLYLVAAFAGSSLVMKAYEQAIADKYNFYSYGDAMFISSRAQNL